MAPVTVHRCPRCELRFAHRSELNDHIGSDHTPVPDEDLPPAAPPLGGTVVVPVDPAQAATLAVPVAAALGRQARFAVEVVAAPSPGLVAQPYVDARVHEATGAGAPRARGLVLADAGDPATAIVVHLGTGDVSLACMATRARTPVGQFVLGSVAAEVVRRSPVPVLLVGPAVRQVGPRIDRIVVGVDGSVPAEGALRVAADLADRLDAMLHLVAVTPVAAPAAAEAAYLESAAARLGVHPSTCNVLQGHSPARAIADFAGDLADTVVVVGTHGRSRAGNIVMGSVAASLARRSAGPVLVVPPTAQPA